MKKLFTLFLLVLCAAFNVAAQRITGSITDSKTGEPVPFANVVYEGAKTGVQSDADGNYSIAFHNAKLTISCVGYEPFSFRPKAGDKVDVKLKPNDFSFGEAKVVGKKEKYSRKDNPAVELMRKVIAAKKNSDLKQHDYYTVEQYNKLNFALADVTPKVFEEGKFKRMPFLKEHVEVSPETGKLILPLSVEETVTQQMYRKSDDTEKNLVVGRRQEGINELINTGEMLTQLLNDFFTTVNLYDNDVRLLQYQFISPLSSSNGIAFYRYFITDTCYVEGTKCIELQFTPNNSRDFGFSGELYVTADSTYRLKRANIGVPFHTGINFVDLMKIEQTYDLLPSGEQVLIKDNMLLVMKLVKDNFKVQAKRTTEYSKFDFSEVPESAMRFRGKTKTSPDAQMKEEEFWAEHRSEQLTQSENKVSLFLDRLQNMKGFKPIIWITKAFIENSFETSFNPKRPSKIDYDPVNTTFGYSEVDGFRLRGSLLTNAHLNPHLFFKGYLAYGFKDERFKGSAEVTYSFNKKKYLPREFPMRNLVFSYTNDVISPSDIHMPTDKDNVFIALKWSKVDHMVYNENFRLYYDNEWENGLRMIWKLSHDKQTPCGSLAFPKSPMEPRGSLFYQPVSQGLHYNYNKDLAAYVDQNNNPVDASRIPNHFEGDHFARPYGFQELVDAGKDPFTYNRSTLTTTDFTFFVQYQPGAEFINTKQRRIMVNKDAPIFGFSHTVGIKGVWSDYTYNNTEIDIYKRWWVHSWGKIDAHLKAGAQWNRVPFPLLCAAWANTSYVREEDMFCLIKNMEFMNDRYVTFMGEWDLNGKLLNRVPLIRRLKWREYFGFNALWGTLTDKNNPYLAQNAGRSDLFFFPARYMPNGAYEQQTQVMNPRKPYIEAYVGIHNIFKLLWIQYVHRITYVNEPDGMYGKTQKWGIRFILKATF